MLNHSELANRLLQIAHRTLEAKSRRTLSGSERQAWETILISLTRLPSWRMALDNLSKDPASLVFRDDFLTVLQELLNQDHSLFQSLAKRLILHEEVAPPTLSVQESSAKDWLADGMDGQQPKDFAKHGAGENADVQFSAFYSKELNPAFWYYMPVYVHVPAMLDAVTEDSQGFLAQSASSGKSSSEILQTIMRGSEIVAVPELPGCTINPPKSSILWFEDWHRMEFRVRAQANTSFQKEGVPTLGRIAFYVGPILVAETRIWAQISNQFNAPQPKNTPERESGNVYQAIFVSYSHKDTTIVERLSTAYKALGMKYLRDVETLRSGEKWNSALLKMIESADIFQLYWSEKAQQSQYVEQEWRFALGLQRGNFIRPIYWEKPMPPVPAELGDIHFAPIDLT